MWVHDPETLRILEVNDAAVDHYGYSREEFIRMTVPICGRRKTWARFCVKDLATNSTKLTGPWRHRRKDGSYIQVDMASHCIDFQGRKCSFVLVQDVTDRQQLHEQLVHQAHHDLLTGLPNRLLLEDRVQQSLAQAARYGQQAAVSVPGPRSFQADQRQLWPCRRRSLPAARGQADLCPLTRGRHLCPHRRG